MWDKIVKWHKNSETILLAHGMAWLGAGMEALRQFPDVAQSVGLQQYVPPAYLGMYTLGIAGLTLMARLHRFDDK